jgi:prepilin-type processing-associated H-X9-DG protein
MRGRPPTHGATMNYLYVDTSNVWIEGMHVSAV